jgi:hypothetical protein
LPAATFCVAFFLAAAFSFAALYQKMKQLKIILTVIDSHTLLLVLSALFLLQAFDFSSVEWTPKWLLGWHG